MEGSEKSRTLLANNKKGPPYFGKAFLSPIHQEHQPSSALHLTFPLPFLSTSFHPFPLALLITPHTQYFAITTPPSLLMEELADGGARSFIGRKAEVHARRALTNLYIKSTNPAPTSLTRRGTGKGSWRGGPWATAAQGARRLCKQIGKWTLGLEDETGVQDPKRPSPRAHLDLKVKRDEIRS